MRLKTKRVPELSAARCRDAFTIVEAMVATVIVGVLFTALYSGITYGFKMIDLSRENLRATQILQEKMETIRLYNWDQINQSGFIPTNFTASFYPTNTSKSFSAGTVYTGAVSIATPSISESYATDLREVTVQLTWESSGVVRTREMTTYVAENGLQNYIY